MRLASLAGLTVTVGLSASALVMVGWFSADTSPPRPPPVPSVSEEVVSSVPESRRVLQVTDDWAPVNGPAAPGEEAPVAAELPAGSFVVEELPILDFDGDLFDEADLAEDFPEELEGLPPPPPPPSPPEKGFLSDLGSAVKTVAKLQMPDLIDAVGEPIEGVVEFSSSFDPEDPFGLEPEFEISELDSICGEMPEDLDPGFFDEFGPPPVPVPPRVRLRVADRRSYRSAGMNLTHIAWEDVARFKNSAVGPNISDMAIQVRGKRRSTGQESWAEVPILRYPNFTDRTVDVPLETIHVMVGNERNQAARRIGLKQYLEDFRSHLSGPNSWPGKRTSLLARRDARILVSAQACFLPVDHGGRVEFRPVLFNYQSGRRGPAVLAIYATREGTSATVLDGRDPAQGFLGSAQSLYYNAGGRKAGFVGWRRGDLDEGDPLTLPGLGAARGVDMAYLIQVPLKRARKLRSQARRAARPKLGHKGPGAGRVDHVVVGHAAPEESGRFVEVNGWEIERDPRYPVRLTVQYFRTIPGKAVQTADMKAVVASVEKVYAQGRVSGSLVVDGDTRRTTEYEGEKVMPKDWWVRFLRRHREEIGMSPREVNRNLKVLMGKDWLRQSKKAVVKTIKRDLMGKAWKPVEEVDPFDGL